MGGGESQNEKNNAARSTSDQAQTDKIAGQSESTLGQYMGDVTKTPLYSSLLRSGTSSTNNAYDAANRNMKQSMESAGVQGSSAAAAGNSAAVGAQRATALGQVQPAAIQTATQDQLQATNLNNQLASTYSGEGVGYGQQATQEQIQQNQQQAGLFGAMLQAGQGIAEDNPFGLTGI